MSTLASGRQVEARQHELDALLDAPSVALFELVLQASELLEQGRRPVACEIDGRAVIGRDEIAQLAETVGDDVEDRARRWRAGRPARAWPDADPAAVHTEPVSGGCSPLTIRSSVDLPGPFRPTTETRSPRSIWSVAFVEQRQLSERERDTVERYERHRAAARLGSTQRTANDCAVQRLGTD